MMSANPTDSTEEAPEIGEGFVSFVRVMAQNDETMRRILEQEEAKKEEQG